MLSRASSVLFRRLLALNGDGKVLNMLSLLIELQRLKRLDRTGWTLRGLPNGTESVAAHSFGVCVTAMMLADEIRMRGTNIDNVRVLGDWMSFGKLPRTQISTSPATLQTSLTKRCSLYSLLVPSSTSAWSH